MKNQFVRHFLLGCGALLVLGQGVAFASPVYVGRADLVRPKSAWSKPSNVDVTEFVSAAEGATTDVPSVPTASTGDSTPVAFTTQARFVPPEVAKFDRTKSPSIKDAKYTGQSVVVEVVPEPASVVVWSVIGCFMVAGSRFRRSAK